MLLAADRFYPSAALITWLQAQGWRYRLRLKGNHLVDVGRGEVTSTADLVRAEGSHFERHGVIHSSPPASRKLG